MQFGIIVPIVTFFALILKLAFGIEIGEEQIQQIADVILNIVLGVITLVGIFKSHQKQKDKK